MGLNSEFKVEKNRSKMKMMAYMIYIIINNIFSNLSFVILSFSTEFDQTWKLISVMFILIAFGAPKVGNVEDSKDNSLKSKVKVGIIVYCIFLVALLIFYSVISLLVNNSSWFFIIVIVVMNSIYLHNYTKNGLNINAN